MMGTVDHEEGPKQRFSMDQWPGYVACEITPSDWRSRYYVADDVTKSDSKVDELASFVVTSGQPGGGLTWWRGAVA